MAGVAAQPLPGPHRERSVSARGPAGSAAPRLDAEGRQLDVADYPGCKTVQIPREAIEDHDGRVEYWDSRTETAMVVCEPTSPFHERPSQRLARLAERIAASRGSIVETFGTSDLARTFAGGRSRVLMQADQVLYLDPPTEAELGPKIDVDRDRLPDVVLGSRLLHGRAARQAAAVRGLGLPGGLARRAG